MIMKHVGKWLIRINAYTNYSHLSRYNSVQSLQMIFKFIIKNKKIMGYHEYQKCIDACLKCAAICNHCASACLKEQDVKMMAKCIQLDMECAALCYASAQLMSLGSEQAKQLCKLCAEVCKRCAEECKNHRTDHCKECAESCNKCAEECLKI